MSSKVSKIACGASSTWRWRRSIARNLWQRALAAAVTVSGDHEHARLVLEAVEKEAALLLGGDLVSATIEWLE